MAPLSVSTDGTTGQCFTMPDLMIARAWAEFHDLDDRVELDCCHDRLEVDEVLSFYLPGTRVRRWRLWRTDGTVILLTDDRSKLRFASLADALDGIGSMSVPPV